MNRISVKLVARVAFGLRNAGNPRRRTRWVTTPETARKDVRPAN